MRSAPIDGMPSSPLSLALAALATTTVLARGMAAVAREARNCLLLWLALRGTSPEQRSQIIKSLPSLEPPPAAPSSHIAKPSDTATSTTTKGLSTTEP